MAEISVIICTHNPRKEYFVRTLDALRAQTMAMEDWELLIIDNASDIPLTSDEWSLEWHPKGRHIRESELGLGPARRRGMREAQSDLLVFVDDDNVLAADYLENALRIGREWPMLGVWGSGITEPEFEVSPPGSVVNFLGMLALRNEKLARWSNTIQYIQARPWGAGQCVRSRIASAYQEYVLQPGVKMNDRTGRSLASGGDVEIAYVACKIGLGIGIFPELKITHLIPKERLTEEYFVRLIEGIATSDLLLEYKWNKRMPTSPFAGMLGLPRVVRNLIFRSGFNRKIYLSDIRARLRARAIIRSQSS